MPYFDKQTERIFYEFSLALNKEIWKEILIKNVQIIITISLVGYMKLKKNFEMSFIATKKTSQSSSSASSPFTEK